MKRIQDIEKLSIAELERIGADESIPVPANLQVRLPRRKAARTWSVAAAAAAVVGLGWFAAGYEPAPKDTFEDPYLAYVAVEQALSRMSAGVNQAAGKVAEAEELMDQMNYWNK